MDGLAAQVAVVAGIWLLTYQVLIQGSLRKAIILLTQFAAGASLLVFQPLVEKTPTWESCLVYVFSGGALGVLMGDMVVSLFATLSLGVGFTQWFWNLTLCSAVADEWWGSMVHIAVSSIVCFAVLLFFICTPLGIVLVELIVFPMLGAMLLATGASGLLDDAQRDLINPLPGTCPGSTGPGFQALASWLFVGFLVSSILIKIRVAKIQQAQKEKDPLNASSKDGALTSLLQTSRPNNVEDGGTGFSKPEGDLSRVHAIARAIPEGSDMSHLTETEKKLVEICRKDSFERDRILFGGGLC
eukprot:gnl/MRDRNA2_/MRDRNA2_94797_c0_seq1.p1 gnl/MRDRNA2_/MRDRNA2_94797_c0~~gnl/MRDRNA2_/MRDRNA2_94797_c0_seq1.p1  ORF type:complete len:300 (+),score=48.79 gnl/MRDRNA2_/MRDRNA2_94797_c0_seq1:176-1075(+)